MDSRPRRTALPSGFAGRCTLPTQRPSISTVLQIDSGFPFSRSQNSQIGVLQALHNSSHTIPARCRRCCYDSVGGGSSSSTMDTAGGAGTAALRMRFRTFFLHMPPCSYSIRPGAADSTKAWRTRRTAWPDTFLCQMKRRWRSSARVFALMRRATVTASASACLTTASMRVELESDTGDGARSRPTRPKGGGDAALHDSRRRVVRSSDGGVNLLTAAPRSGSRMRGYQATETGRWCRGSRVRTLTRRMPAEAPPPRPATAGRRRESRPRADGSARTRARPG